MTATTSAMRSLLRDTRPPLTRRLSYIPSGRLWTVTPLTLSPLTSHLSLQFEPAHRSRELLGRAGQMPGRRRDLFRRRVELFRRRSDLLCCRGILLGSDRHFLHPSRDTLDQPPDFPRRRRDPPGPFVVGFGIGRDVH